MRLSIKKSTVYWLSVNLLATAFLLFYITDGISKYLYRGGTDFYRYGAFLKAFFQLFVLGISIVFVNRARLNILLSLAIFTVCFLIGQYFLSLTFDNLLFFENFTTLFKYLFPFIIFLLAMDIIDSPKYPERLLKVYKWVIGFNSILIILGLIFGIRVFMTYEGPWRFGYDGLIFAQNEASFIFICGVATVYYRRFYLHIKEFFFWLVLIPSLFVATKAVFLFLVFLLIFHIFKRVSMRNILTFGISGLVLGYLLFSSILNKIILNAYMVFMYMYHKEGFLSALLSGRNAFIEEKLVPLIFEHWHIANFLFGGQDVVSHYIEMGFFDLFLFFGIFGTLLYLFLFYKIFQFLPFPRDFKIFFFITLTIIVGTAGHFFESGIAGLHFIFMILINRNIEKNTV